MENQNYDLGLWDFTNTSVDFVVQSPDRDDWWYDHSGYFKTSAIGTANTAQQRALFKCIKNAYWYNSLRFDCTGNNYRYDQFYDELGFTGSSGPFRQQ